MLAKSDAPPPEVNFSMVSPTALAAKRLPRLSNARPVGELNPVLANTVPAPVLSNLSIVLALAFVTYRTSARRRATGRQRRSVAAALRNARSGRVIGDSFLL